MRMSGMGRFGMGRGMGDCGPGQQSVLGVCVPTLSTDLSLIQGGLATAFASGVASTPSVQQAAANAATQGTVTSIINNMKAHPYIWIGVTALALALVAKGAMSYSGSRTA